MMDTGLMKKTRCAECPEAASVALGWGLDHQIRWMDLFASQLLWILDVALFPDSSILSLLLTEEEE